MVEKTDFCLPPLRYTLLKELKGTHREGKGEQWRCSPGLGEPAQPPGEVPAQALTLRCSPHSQEDSLKQPLLTHPAPPPVPLGHWPPPTCWQPWALPLTPKQPPTSGRLYVLFPLDNPMSPPLTTLLKTETLPPHIPPVPCTVLFSPRGLLTI